MGSNDHRLLDQKAIDVIVRPNGSKILPLHKRAAIFFVFDGRYGIFGYLHSVINLKVDWFLD